MTVKAITDNQPIELTAADRKHYESYYQRLFAEQAKQPIEQFYYVECGECSAISVLPFWDLDQIFFCCECGAKNLNAKHAAAVLSEQTEALQVAAADEDTGSDAS